ncbi:MAG: histidine kinase [Burkholderiales bacterium RIFCSPLOWO2_12_67_14]|nr:MAG: histidine kinase [Burkholderiales bacterium RIFCSPLOWO2_02_FULL_67_64]OGB42278.1 MAG: histidine kinase [Burkholderiales bacterium RIFCSPHIGHO2_12_FULL_67_38]OGB46223.1 MAG: histidine kinase [Burkholderiales bacterium RIFCSPLOWO2_12_67_14]OGB73988.1 MAG: histidine kinase [Burkholderiales bacterium RIFCSPLOWO2_12_FULL_67_210]
MGEPSRLSLRRQLLLWLLLPQLVLWAGGGLLAYRFALTYAEKGIDQSLTQSVRALARQVKPIGSGLLIDFPRAAQDVLEQDPNDRISYMVSSPPGKFLLGNQHLPPPPTAPSGENEPLFYGGLLDGKPLRIVALDVSYGDEDARQTLRVQVAKGTALQQRIARELVADMLAPLLALGVLLSLLVYGGIQRGLAPLTKLTAQLENRSVNALSPIGMTQAPSEVHALVQAINGLLDEVARSVHQEKRFINDAAHQLRTPLAGLISQVELAQRDTSEPVLSERLCKVRTGAERSAHLVHQLLTLARTETQARREPLDLAALAREVAREWTPRALAAGMDLGYEGEEHLRIEGDGLQLREALSNLIDNALRYTPRGSTITLRVDRGPDGARLAVEDNGPGLNPEDMAHVFQRFWRGSQLPGGCGLGLAIVQEIAHRHGGEARVEQLKPQGLRIELRLG